MLLSVCVQQREAFYIPFRWTDPLPQANQQRPTPFINQSQTQQQVNLEVDVLAKYVERSVGPIIDQLRDEIVALQTRLATLEKGG